MMKILQVNITANSGSTGRIAEEIGKLVMADGGESYMAYARSFQPSLSSTYKIGSKLGIYFHVLMTRFFDSHGLHSVVATKQFVKYIKQLNPDIIHLHNIHGYYLNYPILLKFLRMYDKPVVWTLHDCWTFTGHCAYFDYAECDRWQHKCYSCPEKHAYPASLINDRSSENYTSKFKLLTSLENLTLVPVSNWLGENMKLSFLKDKKIQVIRNGIDIDSFCSRKSALKDQYGLNGKTIILGIASVWSKRKGFDDFLKLSKRIDNRTHIVLIGLKKKQMQSLPNNILGIQHTESIVELAQWYSLADVFFNPTWEEALGLTNMESIACGTPVITYNTGGSVESISEDTGFVIKQGDIGACLSSIEKIKMNVKYEQTCRPYALKHFDKNSSFKKYIDLYKSLI